MRRGELKNYTELALSAVKRIYNNAEKDDSQAKENVKKILRDLEFGRDGYFFVYDYEGVNIAHPKKPQLEGKNLWNIQDPNGVYLIRSLVTQAQKGNGGFTEYTWDKPSKGREVGKLGYSSALKDWEWMVGTGLYVDDLEEAVGRAENEISNNIKNTLKLIIGLALVSTLIVGLIGARFTMSEGKLADERLQQLSHKAVAGQEEERSRVARDLQKDINKALYAAREKLKSVSQADSLSEPEARSDFVSAVNIINNTIKEVYRISGELRPDVLDKMGLYSAIDALADKISNETTVEVTFDKTTDNGKRLRDEVETALYRIVQEGLNNIVNHSNSDKATIKARKTPTSIQLTIQDYGTGFDAKNVLNKGGKGAVGFSDMRVRAESLGGTFSVFSTDTIGTIIKVEIPA